MEQVPNREYLKFNYVKESATGNGLNKYCEMQMNPVPEDAPADWPRTFKITEGTVGIKVGPNKPRSFQKPAEEWDDFYNQRISHGWLLTSQKKLDKKVIKHSGFGMDNTMYAEIANKDVERIITDLLGYANKAIEQSYSTSLEDISDEMLSRGQDILTELSTGSDRMSVAMFNNKLKSLFATIPRRMDRLNKCLAVNKGDFGKIVENEQQLYDVLKTQLRSTQSTATPGQTIMDAFGIEWDSVTEDEYEFVKQLMDSQNRSRISGIWKVRNKMTEERFNKFCEKKGFNEQNGISYLFHGSPAQNWWSIVTNGLWLRPGECTRNGMFGYGLYFAPESDKSCGYTNMGYWRGDGGTRGYLAVFKVATGNPFWYYRSNGSYADMCLDGITKRGGDCLWAESSRHNSHSSLYRDEVIIYKEEQATVQFLIEIS